MKQLVLVAGMDYEFHGVDFRIYCDSRVKRTVAANRAKQDLTFTIFDVRRAEVVTHEVTYPAGKRTQKVSKLTPSPFKALSRANFDRFLVNGEAHFRLKDSQRGLMSILDVYQAVQKIGVDAPGTLAELSIFSHGFMGGPILVNSTDDGVMNVRIPPMSSSFRVVLAAAARDPDDFDARIKDFSAPTMDAAALADFTNAFHADGHIWIWGCAFPRVVHEILHKIEHHPAYRPRGLGDDVRFRFRNLSDYQAEVLETGLQGVVPPFPDRRNIELEFKFLKHFACRVTRAGFSQQVASRTGITTYGAPMGTYSEYDKGPLPLMHVHKGFTRHFTFYKNYLGFAFDPEGKKYAKHIPGFTCPAP
jgi:hypothetical protein